MKKYLLYSAGLLVITLIIKGIFGLTYSGAPAWLLNTLFGITLLPLARGYDKKVKRNPVIETLVGLASVVLFLPVFKFTLPSGDPHAPGNNDLGIVIIALAGIIPASLLSVFLVHKKKLFWFMLFFIITCFAMFYWGLINKDFLSAT